MGVRQHLCSRRKRAKALNSPRMGAPTVNPRTSRVKEALTEAVKRLRATFADFAFQCTGNPHAHSNIHIHSSATAAASMSLASFHQRWRCKPSTRISTAPKRSNLVGSWVYNLRDYATTFDFLKRAKAIDFQCLELGSPTSIRWKRSTRHL